MQLIGTLRIGSSVFINDILDIILYDMLVIERKKTTLGGSGAKGHDKEPSDDKARIDCFRLAKKLDIIVWKGQNDGYFTKPASGSLPDPILETPQTVDIPESATELVKRRLMVLSTFAKAKSSVAASVSTEMTRPMPASISTEITHPTRLTPSVSAEMDIEDPSKHEQQPEASTIGSRTKLNKQQALPLRCAYIDTDDLVARLTRIYGSEQFELKVC